MTHKLLLTAFLLFALTGCFVFQEDTSGLVELVEKAVANESEWKGKEVTIYGYVSYYSPSPDGFPEYLHLETGPTSVNERPHGPERLVTCFLADVNGLEPISRRYVTVEGKIAGFDTDYKWIALEPCELVK